LITGRSHFQQYNIFVKTRLLNIIRFDELRLLEFQGDKDTRQCEREENDHRWRF
jgi:hypothetical protein